MGIPLRQQIRVGAYVLKQRLRGRARYPLVLMLEPLFRCNLACAGCGKIDYPAPILNRRLSLQECLDAVAECGAPIVSIPGGEPLIHKEIAEIVKALVERRKFVYLCTNALLVEKKIDLFTPEPLPHLLDPSRRPARAPRPLGLPGGRVRPGGGGDPAAARARLPRQRQRDPVRRRGAGGGRGVLRLRHRGARRRGHHGVARLRLRAGARPARTSSIAARPSSCSATSSAAAAASAGGSTTPRCISTSSPATRNTAARPGATRPATSSAGSARAICSARAMRARSRS